MGWTALAENAGMLFVFDQEQRPDNTNTSVTNIAQYLAAYSASLSIPRTRSPLGECRRRNSSIRSCLKTTQVTLWWLLITHRRPASRWNW